MSRIVKDRQNLPAKLASVLATLVALNSMFEMTLLGSKTRFFCAEGTGIQRLNEGFQFFWDWAEELVVSGAFHDRVDGVDRKTAWQVCVFLMPTVCDGWSIEGKHTHNGLFNAHLLLLWCSELI